MDLLDFARGPALQVALGIFVLGVTWRLMSLLLLPRLRDKSVPKKGTLAAPLAAVWEVIRRTWPDKVFARQTMVWHVNGFVFHFGLAIVILFFAPHIAFFRDLLGISWPALPNNAIYAVGALTVAALVISLIRRFANPVQRLLSGADDYFSWLVTFLPVITGLLANSHLVARYETLLAIHILCVAAFLIWLPFGKLMHTFYVFIARGQTGAHLARRGAQL